MPDALTPIEPLKALALAKVWEVPWIPDLKVEDIAYRALEFRAACRFQGMKARREGREAASMECYAQANAILELVVLFGQKSMPGETVPFPTILNLREADKALLRAQCIENGAEDWLPL